jgi:F420-dependent oxidoreductase-like protein
MRLGNSLEYSGDPIVSANLVAQREQAGVDVVWVAEAYGFDSPTLMGYLAGRTTTVEIGSGVINVFSRTPTAIAQTAAGLDNVSGGRAILGLGASGPQVIEGFHGVPYEKPLSRIRDVVHVVRDVLRREAPLQYDGATVSVPLPTAHGTGLGKPLKLINRPNRSAVPIYLASVTEKSVEMTAEIADGWWPALFMPEMANAVWGGSLEAGFARRDAALGPLQIACGPLLLAITEGAERERLLDAARNQIALYVGGMGAAGKNFYNDVFARSGFADAARKIQELYLSGNKAEAAALVPRTALENMNLIGSPGFIKERIAAYAESGVTVLNVTPASPDLDLISTVKGWLPMVDENSCART